MSTRSRIGIEEEHGTVRSVYCHLDGYESGVGATLLKAYIDPQKIRDLISQGGISSLKEEIGGTTFYHRDRDEDLLIQTNSSRKEFKNEALDSWEEYTYLFVVAKGHWIYSPRGKKNFVKLTEKTCSGDK